MSATSDGPGRGLWDTLAQGVHQASEPKVDLWATLNDRLDFSRQKPRQAQGIEVVRQAAAGGGEYYILRNPRANTYLKIDPLDYFIWERLDGQYSVRDLAVAYFAEYRAFPFDRLANLIGQLRAKKMLAEKQVQIMGKVAGRLQERTLAYKLQRFADTSMQKEFPLRNIDRFYGTLYRRLAWLLFTPPALIVGGLLALAGLACFVYLLSAGAYPLLQAGDSYGLGLLVLMLANYIMIFFHESGHALTVKHYGRSILKGGMMFYYGSPAFFIDTTDIWMAPKSARVATSFAGPAADMLVCGLFAVAAVLLPASPLSPFFYKLAAVGYLGVIMNLAPVMELDGYFILMDSLEIPLLRKKSLAFVWRRLPTKLLAERTAFSREERIFAIYGILTGAWTTLSVLLTLYLWPTQVQALIRSVASGADILSAILVGGLVIIAAIPMIFGLAIKTGILAGAAGTRIRDAVRRFGAGAAQVSTRRQK